MTEQKTVKVGDIEISNDAGFTLIAGPCQIESLEHSIMMAEKIAQSCKDAGDIPFIYKSSFDKANRSSHTTKRGVGIDKGLEILSTVKEKFGCPILTDVHDAGQCGAVAEVADVLQIPAFLCRQTDLLLAAGNSGAAVNVKKGQFLAPWDMINVADKIASTGNKNIMLCERGTSFGYNALVVDFRGLPIMAATGWPVIFDATHCVQQPGGLGKTSGGQREFVPTMAKAAAAVGCAGMFMEVHENPDSAPSDGANMLQIENLEPLLRTIKKIKEASSK